MLRLATCVVAPEDSEQINPKGAQPLFTPHLIREEMIIDPVCIYGGLITTPQLTLFLGTPAREGRTLQLNHKSRVSAMLITSSPVLTDRATDPEVRGGRAAGACKDCAYDTERSRCCLCCHCVKSA